MANHPFPRAALRRCAPGRDQDTTSAPELDTFISTLASGAVSAPEKSMSVSSRVAAPCSTLTGCALGSFPASDRRSSPAMEPCGP